MLIDLDSSEVETKGHNRGNNSDIEYATFGVGHRGGGGGGLGVRDSDFEQQNDDVFYRRRLDDSRLEDLNNSLYREQAAQQ